MLTAVVARPPVFGAKLKSVDDSAAKAIKGVKAVLRVPLDRGGEGVAVVADGYWAAKQGRDALKLEWDTSGVEKVDSAKQLAQLPRTGEQARASASTTPTSRSWRSAPHKIERRIRLPLPGARADGAAQLHRRPRGRQGAEVWIGTPDAGHRRAWPPPRCWACRRRASRSTCRWPAAASAVAAMPTSDYVVEACSVAKAAQAAGIAAPIRTLWSREDDIKGGYYRPDAPAPRRDRLRRAGQGPGLGPRHRRPVDR